MDGWPTSSRGTLPDVRFALASNQGFPLPAELESLKDSDRGKVLIADGTAPRIAGRRPINVAVGILWNSEQNFLMTTRPPGKVYAGYWEFPGGKLEAAETVEDALRRELREELGIQVQAMQRWKFQRVDYPHALVSLHFVKVTSWIGALQMNESQSFSWQSLPIRVGPVLPGASPVLEWIKAEQG